MSFVLHDVLVGSCGGSWRRGFYLQAVLIGVGGSMGAVWGGLTSSGVKPEAEFL